MLHGTVSKSVAFWQKSTHVWAVLEQNPTFGDKNLHAPCTVLYFGSKLNIILDPIGTQPLPPVLFGVPQQRQVRAAAVALVDSRVPLKLNSGPHAGEPAGKHDGSRRSRTCMVPSPPEAHTASYQV